MNARSRINRILKNRIVLLDGATGTELQKQGMPSGACPEFWALHNPVGMAKIHRAYKDAGSDIVYTCTFGGNRLKLNQYGLKNITETNRRLAEIAKKAVGGKTLVAADIGPTGHFVEPFGDLPFEDAVDIYKEQIHGLIDGGVDLLIIETMLDIQETRAALIAAKELSDIYTIVTMTFETNGRTLNGTDPLAALITLQSLGADAVGCNCSTGPETMNTFIAAMKPYAKVPLAAKPNAGLPRVVDGVTCFDMTPLTFAEQASRMAETGAGFIGGCCGTTPDHIRELKKALAGRPAVAPVCKSTSAVSSAAKARIFSQSDPLVIVGERINPTGKKDLQQELLAGKYSLVRRMAKDQEQAGADLLDVNIGVPNIDEQETIRDIVHLLSTVTELPLVIDSSDIDTIATALRLYPGRALINSISGEPDKIERLLPLAAKYGAMFILLPMTGKILPETAEKRIAIIRDIFKKAQAYGFTKEDIVVDGLVMTVASDPAAPVATTQTIEWCTRTFGCRTIVGLSNVSFGLPERRWINATLLAMAQQAGLTMAIANPAIPELMAVKRSGDVLLGRDPQAAAYIAHFAEQAPVTGVAPTEKKLNPLEKLSQVILDGNKDDILDVIRENLDQGFAPGRLVDEIMIPAINRVGDLYEQKRCFLPQLMASAETMKKGMAHLEPLLAQDGTTRAKAVILIATVKGDIHDIGKNIVALLLRNQGYVVIDLGKDVPAETIIAEMKAQRPDAVALSALMTTTMVNMKGVIDLARSEGETCPFMVGGAVVTAAFAQSIGAHYAKDGVVAAKVVEALINKR
ncbi:MAG TPA: homocysteine S-methyltransferase family protein [Syntrophales bacterium]|nr:homocysteine S-methyltransferase family protein [Syntrophales bacterium]